MEEKQERVSWSEAPVDVLGLILSKLCGLDALAFASVCRHWRPVPRVAPTPTNDDEEFMNCPCLILPDKRFFNPMYNVFFVCETTYAIPKGNVLAQNYGWLLMVKGINTPFFFFNPFTGERIDLPAAPKYFSTSVTFSSPPDSHDCEIVCIRSKIPEVFLKEEKELPEEIIIQTIKRREDEFQIRHRFNCTRYGFWMAGRFKVVYFRGEYYYMGKEGNLGIYNSKTNSHRFILSAHSLWPYFYSQTAIGRFMFEGEGDLWAVFIAWKGQEICVCKLNRRKKRWEKVHDLEDRMVFLSHICCYMERAKFRGENKIYFPRLHGENCLFYSLATGKYHTFESGTSFDNFESTKEKFGTWIKMDAASTTTCEKELSWLDVV